MVVITAIGWAVSPVISLILNKTESYISKKLFNDTDLEREMEKMKITLLEILSTMVKVEKQGIEDQHQEKMVWKIKDAVYDAEDFIDELDYYNLEVKSVQQESTVSLNSFLSTHQVKEVNDKLNLVKGSAEKLLQLLNVNNSSNKQYHQQENQRVTSSNITEKIIGRNNERELLINLLKEKVEGSPTIIQIKGHGGVGKTTLAQMAYNDPRVTNHFEQKMWLTVSDNFDKLSLTKEMLKYVCEDFSTLDVGFDKLQEKLKTELPSKKVLLVLDDVWFDMDDQRRYINEKQWSEFLVPLNTAKAGTKIMLTSRQELRKSTSLSTRLFPLEGLNDDDSWSLFEMCAFDSENQHKRRELEPIAKEIVKKLKGLSLAIRVVGTQLRGRSDVEEWETLNNNPLDTSDVMNILYLSYKHLPQHLKNCFAYCSIFPKDYRFKPDRLVHMWIAQGFVHPEEQKNLENVGKSYFKGLLARSFFQVIKKGSKEHYVMHDIMNDLACHVSKGECYRLKKGDPITNLGSIRHLSVTYEARDILMNIVGLDKLRTLLFLSTSWRIHDEVIDIQDNLMFKRIRVLDLEHGISNLGIIGKCKHLRYLSFRNSFFNGRLPDCFKKLHHLNVLFVGKNGTLGGLVLPKFSCSLQFIDFSKSIIHDVGEQVQQIVPTLYRGGSVHLDLKNKNGYGLDVLGGMNNIKGSINITGLDNVTSTKEAIQAQLHKKHSVTTIELQWDYDTHPSETESSKCQGVCEALVPNHNLEYLYLFGFIGAAWPSWLETNLLTSVKSIDLFKCTNVKMLPSLGKLPLLKALNIAVLLSVRRIGLEFYGKGMFSSLNYLNIDNLESLEEWCYPCDTPIFPKLDTLLIRGVKLECFPLPQYVQIRLTRLEISHCEKLIRLEGLDELVSLRRLYIEDCPNLLFISEMKHFYSLEFLAIFDCPKLSPPLPKKGLPVSLRLLCIGGIMHPSLECQIQNKEGPDWNKVAAISGCHLCVAFGILRTIYMPNSGLKKKFLRKTRVLTNYIYARLAQSRVKDPVNESRDNASHSDSFVKDPVIALRENARHLSASVCLEDDYSYQATLQDFGVYKGIGAQYNYVIPILDPKRIITYYSD